MTETPDSPFPSAAELYDHAACGLLLTRADGLILRANATFCSWLGVERDAIVGHRKFQELLTMGGRIFHQTHWYPLLQMQGSVAEVKLEVARADGKVFSLMLNAVRRSYGGETLHELAVTMAQDRDRYERELLQARKRSEALLIAAEQMVGIVSHDLRNPLAAIAMSAQLLNKTSLADGPSQVISRIVNATGRAQRLIADLLDFTASRLGSGLQVLVQPVDLHSVVAQGTAELAAAFPGREIVHESSGVGTCRADPDRLIQLLSNLISNAVTYGAPDKRISVVSRIDEQGFEVSVRNGGAPIPAAMMASIFEPMTRGSDAGDSRSVGLGLFIVSAIVKAHGGRTSVTSTLKEGTTFTARFPVALSQPI
ncbi:MAG: HAMP domain-containing sensor histidine kinase [Pseudomonadota bacterium]